MAASCLRFRGMAGLSRAQTDTPLEKPSLEPRALPEEFDYLLSHLGRYLTHRPSLRRRPSAFYAGLRPLVSKRGSSNTAALSRDHVITQSRTGLITIAGGKWDDLPKRWRRTLSMSPQRRPKLTEAPCRTVELPLYVANGENARSGIGAVPERKSFSFVQNEMARTIEDVLFPPHAVAHSRC